jgi:RNA polymerase sigma-70 factor (ECF subfamily)
MAAAVIKSACGDKNCSWYSIHSRAAVISRMPGAPIEARYPEQRLSNNFLNNPSAAPSSFMRAGMSWAGQVTLDEVGSVAAAVVDVEQIVHHHARFVFGVAYSVLRNREDAEDAVQETFLRLSRQRNLAEIRDVRLWLARVAWRVAVDRVRQHREHSTDAAPEILNTIADPAPGAEQVAVERQMKEMLDFMIERLPRDLREVVLLTTVQEMSSADIGQVLGIPEGTVRQRLFRARQVLREKMLAAIHPSPR